MVARAAAWAMQAQWVYCPVCFFRREKLSPLREIYASGGGLLAASINVPHLLAQENRTFKSRRLRNRQQYNIFELDSRWFI